MRGRSRTVHLGTLLLLALFVHGAGAQEAHVPLLQDLNGRPVTLVPTRGRIVLINFWATWCTPCREEMPELNRIFGHIDSHAVAIVGIAADDPAPVRAFVSKLAIGYPIAVGNAAQVFAYSAALGNTSEGLPFTVLLDDHGRVRWMKSGGRLSESEVTSAINRLRATAGGS